MFESLWKWFSGRTAAARGGAAKDAADPHAPVSDLRDGEEQFGKLVAGVRDYAVFILDAKGCVVTWNAGAELIKGYRPAEIIGRHFSTFYTSDAVSSGWPAHELEVASATGRFEDEGWRVRKDGTRFWASVVITALREDSGAVRGFLKITRDLTDRKQAEEKLRMSEERFRLLVEGVKDYAIFMLDPDGTVATWNAGAERLKGWKASEIVGRSFRRFYTQDALEQGRPEEELRRAVAEGRVEDEGWRIRKDGTTFWAGVVVTALRDESGTLRGFAKVTRDLTERRLADENLRRLYFQEASRRAAEESRAAAEAAVVEIERRREQLQVTLSSIGDAVVVTDEKGAVSFLNPIAAELTGWPPHEAAGRPLEEVFRIINERSRAAVENPVDVVFRENRIVELANHTAIVSKSGKEIPIEDSAAPIRGRDGRILGAVLVFRDVTEARRSAEARYYLASIVESTEDAVIGRDLDGRVVSWNRGAERLYGWTAEEMIGEGLGRLVPADHPDELPTIMNRIKSGESIDHYETQRLRKDGGRVDVSLTISPVRDGEGTIVGASKIARDITARKEEDRRKSEFLAVLAHELRNPLAPLRNGLQILRLAGDDKRTAEDARALMERQLQHLVRLVDDLLDVGRISRGKLELRKERISLAQAVEDALDLCGPIFKERGHAPTVTLPAEELPLDADRTRLAQAFGNLLHNAAKYTDPGGRISLSAERQGSWAVVRVQDDGTGIPGFMLPRVFDMFVQVDRSLEKAQGGMGVGLTIVKRLIEMHGGGVEARSAGCGRGSEFVVRLPLASPVAPPPTDATQEPEPAPRRPRRRRILVVDDNVDSATSLAMMLEMMGNEVRTAHDGQAGVEAAAEFAADVIVLDIGMPRLNGYDAARAVRAQPGGESVVLVALTGWGQEEDRLKSKEAGFAFHLVKPIDPAALERLLSELEPHAV